MDEEEFQRLLDLFPVVRPRDFHIGIDQVPRQSSSRKLRRNEALKKWQDAWEERNEGEIENRAVDPNDAFWNKLKLAAEKKVGAAEAERFCRAFQQVHSKLVHEELTLDAARRFVSLSKGYGK